LVVLPVAPGTAESSTPAPHLYRCSRECYKPVTASHSAAGVSSCCTVLCRPFRQIAGRLHLQSSLPYSGIAYRAQFKVPSKKVYEASLDSQASLEPAIPSSNYLIPVTAHQLPLRSNSVTLLLSRNRSSRCCIQQPVAARYVLIHPRCWARLTKQECCDKAYTSLAHHVDKAAFPSRLRGQHSIWFVYLPAPTAANTRSASCLTTPAGLSEEQITDIFNGAGKVEKFRLVYDSETGRPKGFGFADYPDTGRSSCAASDSQLTVYRLGCLCCS
jgi:hypothetical protein